MTRTDFVKTYAARSELSDEWAILGFIEIGKKTLIALPCGCEQDGCEGWAMLGADSISHHLAFYAPEKLREAYRECLGDLIS